MNIKGSLVKLKSFILECRRVWKVTKKPNRPEFISIIKVTGLGILIIGFIGFLIAMLWQVIR